MKIRKSLPDDIDLILSMYDHSRSVMRADGNTVQWVGYPMREDVEEDIRRDVSYIIENTQLKKEIGTFALVPGVEPTYGYIDSLMKAAGLPMQTERRFVQRGCTVR